MATVEFSRRRGTGRKQRGKDGRFIDQVVSYTYHHGPGVAPQTQLLGEWHYGADRNVGILVNLPRLLLMPNGIEVPVTNFPPHDSVEVKHPTYQMTWDRGGEVSPLTTGIQAHRAISGLRKRFHAVFVVHGVNTHSGSIFLLRPLGNGSF